MASWEIIDVLDAQGFEWRTATPRREIHAALLNLKGANKNAADRYEHGEAEEIYKSMLDLYGLTEEAETEAATNDDNDR